MFDSSVASQDSFTELTSGATMTSLPVPVNSWKSAVVESTPRSRISRTLAFDDESSPARRTRAASSVSGRRRCHRTTPSNNHQLPRLSTDLTTTQPRPSHVTTPVIISRCLDEDDERADLIGDMTKKHVLPLELNSKHSDLKTISPHTVSCL